MNKEYRKGFTIVELLVVIVVIGILAAITVVSYSGITNRAKTASLQSDLTNSSKLLKIFYIDNGVYPATISTDCSTNPTTTTNLCLKPSHGTDFSATPYFRSDENSFGLTATNGNLVYCITENSSPTVGECTAPNLAITDPANWMTVGTQVWAKANINVGTMVSGSTTQTNNGTVEKYCYEGLTAYCTTYGGLYQWDEAMQYTTTEGAKGICPSGSHIPTDNDWKILEVYLGITQLQADTTGWRGAGLKDRLKVGGDSGLELPYAGYRDTNNVFYLLTTNADIWASSQVDANAKWFRSIDSGISTVYRGTYGKDFGFSVRCIGN